MERIDGTLVGEAFDLNSNLSNVFRRHRNKLECSALSSLIQVSLIFVGQAVCSNEESLGLRRKY